MEPLVAIAVGSSCSNAYSPVACAVHLRLCTSHSMVTERQQLCLGYYTRRRAPEFRLTASSRHIRYYTVWFCLPSAEQLAVAHMYSCLLYVSSAATCQVAAAAGDRPGRVGRSTVCNYAQQLYTEGITFNVPSPAAALSSSLRSKLDWECCSSHIQIWMTSR